MAASYVPYPRRMYLPQQSAASLETPFQRSFKAGSSIGGSLGDLANAIVNMREQQRLDTVANRLMTAASGPQYDPVSDVVNEQGLGDQFQVQTPEQQATSVANATAANQPMGGGQAELALRQKFQQDQLANQLRQAQVANQLAQLQGTGRYASQAGAGGLSANQLAINARVAQNQAIKQAYADQKANSDSIAKVYSDFDKIHGKGSAAEVYNAIQSGAGARFRGSIVTGPDGAQHWQGDPNGPLFTLDPRAAHNAPIDKDFQVYNMDELNSYYGRIQTIQQKGSGGAYRPPLAAQPVNPLQGTPGAPLPTTPPTEEEATGDTGIDTELESETPQASADQSSNGNIAQANLPQPTTQDEYDALPNGSHFIDGDGMIKRKYAA